MKESVKLAREALAKKRQSEAEARKQWEEDWYQALGQHLMEVYGTTNPTFNQMYGGTKKKYAGRNERDEPIYAKVPYYTCMCPEVTTDVSVEEFGKTYNIKDISDWHNGGGTITITKSAIAAGKHVFECPFKLMTREEKIGN